MPVSKIIIKSSDDMGKLLTELTRQVALRRLRILIEGEGDVQDKLAADLDSLSSTAKAGELEEDDTSGDEDKEKKDASDDKVNADEDKDQEIEEISSQTIIEKLNTIRSGHSLKRSDIREQMEEYIDALDDAEKVALNAFLEGIAAIITGSQDGQDAEEPSPEVTMKTKTKVVDKIKPKKRTIPTNNLDVPTTKTVEKPKLKKSKPSGSAEDSTPPIKVT